MSCTVFGAKPAVNVTWVIDGLTDSTINRTTTETILLNDDTFNTTSVLEWEWNRGDDEENITCVATGPAVEEYSELYVKFEEKDREPSGEFHHEPS